jgi:hypothetical protein
MSPQIQNFEQSEPINPIINISLLLKLHTKKYLMMKNSESQVLGRNHVPVTYLT